MTIDGLVSVVIPVHNGRRYVAAALDSILAQKHRPLEIVAVDDGSTDSSADLIQSYAPEVRLIRQSQQGPPAARNAGIRAATGEFLAFLDHDDVWCADKLEHQLARFERDPKLDLVFGHMQNFFTPEMPDQERARLSVPLHPLPGLLQTSMLARRSSFDRIGPFAETGGLGEFVRWYGLAVSTGLKIEMLTQIVCHRRIHASNYQRTHGNQNRDYLAAVKELLDRRRGLL